MAHIPYGYRIEKGKAVFEETKAEQIRLLFVEYVSGSSLLSAGKNTGVGSNHSSLGRIIDNSVYMGDDFYPAIISKEMWNKAQEERKRRVEALGRNKNYFAKDKSGRSPFWGKIFCSECGSEYRFYSEDGKERWKCGRRVVRKKLCCNSPMIPEHLFEDAFMKMVSEIDVSEIAVEPPRQKTNIEKKYDDPFKQAEYAYSQTTIDDFDYQTEKLVIALQDIPTEFSGEFMLNMLKRIEVAHSGSAAFVLINDKRFREELITDAKSQYISDTCKGAEPGDGKR